MHSGKKVIKIPFEVGIFSLKVNDMQIGIQKYISSTSSGLKLKSKAFKKTFFSFECA